MRHITIHDPYGVPWMRFGRARASLCIIHNPHDLYGWTFFQSIIFHIIFHKPPCTLVKMLFLKDL